MIELGYRKYRDFLVTHRSIICFSIHSPLSTHEIKLNLLQWLLNDMTISYSLITASLEQKSFLSQYCNGI